MKIPKQEIFYIIRHWKDGEWVDSEPFNTKEEAFGNVRIYLPHFPKVLKVTVKVDIEEEIPF